MTDELQPVSTSDLPAVVSPSTAPSPAAVYLARLAAGSRRTMTGCLETLVRIMSGDRLTVEDFPWHALRYEHTQAVRARLAEHQAPETANKHLSALRGVIQEAWRLELMSAEDYQRAADVENVRGSRLPAGRHVERGELKALAAVCRSDPKPSGVRDGAMLGTVFTAG